MTLNDSTRSTSLRLWPGVAAAAVLLVLRFIAPLVLADGELIGILGSVAAGAAILLWWLFLSRAPWLERLGILALMIAAVYATLFVVHPSIRGGMMGRMLFFYLAIPFVPLAVVGGAAISRQLRLAPGARRAAIAAAILAACASFALLRTDGIMSGGSQITWRWTPTAEERLLAQAQDLPAPAPAAAAAAAAPAEGAGTARPSAAPAAATPSDPAAVEPAKKEISPAPPPSAAAARMDVRWPGFRGARRDGVIRGVQIETDWTTSPPVAIWRRPIGPGWSSFAVAGDLLYTQEQRGDDEIVAAYNATTGKPVWVHKDPARFYESNGGAGPRATPTLADGRVYAMGATGILNALDAATGALLWTRNTAADTGVKLPGWGFTASPLVDGELVVIATSGALAAYDRATGEPRWKLKSIGGSYSSPQLVAIEGTPQILLLGGSGLASFAPADGTQLWKYEWEGTPIVQPHVTDDGDIVLTTSDAMGGLGARRLHVTRGDGGWKVEERWTSNGLKPYFSDYVLHEGHAYGFDGSILACVDLADGKRKWKGGRYGNGQIVLLPDQDLLLVLSEEGELALVKAAPDQFTEVASRIPAIEGKTWTHPVIVGDRLLVRNGEEMAAFRLPIARRTIE
jgi:outer membrane protein assembly factor BamB